MQDSFWISIFPFFLGNTAGFTLNLWAMIIVWICISSQQISSTFMITFRVSSNSWNAHYHLLFKAGKWLSHLKAISRLQTPCLLEAGHAPHGHASWQTQDLWRLAVTKFLGPSWTFLGWDQTVLTKLFSPCPILPPGQPHRKSVSPGLLWGPVGPHDSDLTNRIWTEIMLAFSRLGP